MMNIFERINKESSLDFPMPPVLKNTILEIEEAILQQDDAEYHLLSDALDVLCKNLYSEKKNIKRTMGFCL